MSGLSGITPNYLAGKMPAGTHKELSPTLNGLFGKGVARSPDAGGSPRAAFGEAGAGDVRTSIKADLRARIGYSSDRADQVLGKIDDKAMASVGGRGNKDRVANLTKAEAKELKSQLHYAFGKRVGNAEDRMINRGAILNAFAQGASLEDTRALRTFLDGATREQRQTVLGELNKPNANPARIIAQHTSSDPDLVGVTSNNRGTLISYLLEVSPETSYFAIDTADQYISSNKSLDIDLSSEIGKNTSAELATISAYTGSNFPWNEINSELREQGRGGNPLSDETRLYVNAAKSGLTKLPDFEGVVVRGVNFRDSEALGKYLANYEVGKTVTEHAFVSTGAEKSFAGNVQFVIESKHGKEITDLSLNSGIDGREVLFQPGTQFEVLAKAHDQDTGKHFIVMKEVG